MTTTTTVLYKTTTVSDNFAVKLLNDGARPASVIKALNPPAAMNVTGRLCQCLQFLSEELQAHGVMDQPPVSAEFYVPENPRHLFRFELRIAALHATADDLNAALKKLSDEHVFLLEECKLVSLDASKRDARICICMGLQATNTIAARRASAEAADGDTLISRLVAKFNLSPEKGEEVRAFLAKLTAPAPAQTPAQAPDATAATADTTPADGKKRLSNEEFRKTYTGIVATNGGWMKDGKPNAEGIEKAMRHMAEQQLVTTEGYDMFHYLFLALGASAQGDRFNRGERSMLEFLEQLRFRVDLLANKAGVRADQVASDGSSVLHTALRCIPLQKIIEKPAIMSVVLDTMRTVVQSGCDIAARNAAGETALQAAARLHGLSEEGLEACLPLLAQQQQQPEQEQEQEQDEEMKPAEPEAQPAPEPEPVPEQGQEASQDGDAEMQDSQATPVGSQETPVTAAEGEQKQQPAIVVPEPDDSAMRDEELPVEAAAAPREPSPASPVPHEAEPAKPVATAVVEHAAAAAAPAPAPVALPEPQPVPKTLSGGVISYALYILQAYFMNMASVNERKEQKAKLMDLAKELLDFVDRVAQAWESTPDSVDFPDALWWLPDMEAAKKNSADYRDNMEEFIRLILVDAMKRAIVRLEDASNEQHAALRETARRLVKSQDFDVGTPEGKAAARNLKHPFAKQMDLMPILTYATLVFGQKVAAAVEMLPDVEPSKQHLRMDWSAFFGMFGKRVTTQGIYTVEERGMVDDVKLESEEKEDEEEEEEEEETRKEQPPAKKQKTGAKCIPGAAN
jgi:hypothetical protein